MDQFRTVIPIPEAENKISYYSKLMMMGSCFVENIGDLLVSNKFNVSVNPFGVIYNPISVVNSLELILDEVKFVENDLHFDNDLWFSYSHHGSFSDVDKEKCLDNINNSISKSNIDLKTADVLFITFGTSWVYELSDSNQIVSNCHKQPAKSFNRYRLNVDEIVACYKELILNLSLFNPQLKIVFTVSPIRHWKDGAHGNQLSKATLLLAVEQLCELFNQVSYFPSYEIVMDELRDYRFYAEDMLHMNPTSVNYIWSRFQEVYMSKETMQSMKQVRKLVSAANHRPFNPETEGHQNFVKKTFESMQRLEKQLPGLSFQDERSLMRKNLQI